MERSTPGCQAQKEEDSHFDWLAFLPNSIFLMVALATVVGVAVVLGFVPMTLRAQRRAANLAEAWLNLSHRSIARRN